MKKISRFLVIAFVFMFCISTGIFANIDNHNKKIDDLLQKIMIQENVSGIKDINIENVSKEDLVALGNAVMDQIYPDSKRHEWMDNMMGGEGSQSLNEMHRYMGYNFLRSGGDIRNISVMPMMYYNQQSYKSAPYVYRNYMGKKGWWRHMYPEMMGNYGVEYGFVGIFVKVFFLVLIIAFVYLMARRNRHHPMWGQHMESAIDIAKKRYAKGELTKEEYQDILKNLK